MINQARYSSTNFRVAKTAALIGAPLLLLGCGGDGSVGIAGGQNPDPVVLDFPIAYVKRPIPLDDDGNIEQFDARELIDFVGASDLFYRDRASPSTPDRNLTESLFGGQADVRDAEFSHDGTKLVFALRAPLDPGLDEDDPAQPTWNIWEYDTATDLVRRIIASDITAEAGHDVMPDYLPDGRIVFSSTRQRQSKAILLDEGKPQYEALDEDENEPAFLLHVMNADGTDVHQVSFNQSHDMDPSVMSDGRIVFSRWDHALTNNGIHLYTMNPDGSNLRLLYGANSHDTGTNGGIVQFLQPREVPDGRVMAMMIPFVGTDGGGDIIFVDTPNYIENTQPTMSNVGGTGPAQSPATTNDIRTDGGISPGGQFGAIFPLWDGTERVMMSWSLCRLLLDDGTAVPPAPPTGPIVPCTPQNQALPNAVPAPPLFGIWIYDPNEQTQLPIVPGEEGFIYTDVTAAQPRPLPTVIPDGVAGLDLNPDFVSQGVGVLHIRSVYDFDGTDMATPDIATLADPAQTTADERAARFVRFIKPVSMFDEDLLDFDLENQDFGPNRGLGMRDILGYAMVEPDGSVIAKVPANVALGVQILDAQGRRISPRHENWLQVRPGEVTNCNGCHDPTTGLSHGRDESFASANPGSQTTGAPFPNTDPALFADFGETMAETRFRIGCATDCSVFDLSMDVVFDDLWTDEVAAGRLKDPSFAYSYTGLTTPAPTTSACITNWSSLCRGVVNFAEHINPILQFPRVVLDVDGVTVLADNTCTTCHNTVDAMGAAMVPASQLDLTDGPSDQEADHLTSYRELFFTDNELELDVNGVLVERQVQVGIDANGNPILAPVPVAPSASAAGALASGTFFNRFDTGGTHEGRLTDHELRLITEWVDVGAQYYNNPFLAPQ